MSSRTSEGKCHLGDPANSDTNVLSAQSGTHNILFDLGKENPLLYRHFNTLIAVHDQFRILDQSFKRRLLQDRDRPNVKRVDEACLQVGSLEHKTLPFPPSQLKVLGGHT